MGKLIDLGSAGPDHPIYRGDAVIHARPPAPAKAGKQSKKKLKEHLPTPVQSGRVCVVYSCIKWVAGKVIDKQVAQPVVFETMEAARAFSNAKWDAINKVLDHEIEVIDELDTNPMQLSGYTSYCVIAEANESLDRMGWESIFSGDDVDVEHVASHIRSYNGCECLPDGAGAGWTPQDKSEIVSLLIAHFG